MNELSEVPQENGIHAGAGEGGETESPLLSPLSDRVAYPQKKRQKVKRVLQWNPETHNYRLVTVPKHTLGYHEKLVRMLGDKCSKCGLSDVRTFHLDHIKGGGTEDRKKHGPGLQKFCIYYLDNIDEAREKLQLLCANCHTIKHRTIIIS